jgi:hypothetical protein
MARNYFECEAICPIQKRTETNRTSMQITNI